jgi:hypothetical protein
MPENAIGVFELFFTEELIRRICNASNEFRSSPRFRPRRRSTLKEAANNRDPVTPSEMWLFLAMRLLISIHNKTNIDDNWSNSIFLSSMTK